MALVLKTSRLTSRRFESCPFRQISETKAYFGFSYLKEGNMDGPSCLSPSLVNINFGAAGGIDTEI